MAASRASALTALTALTALPWPAAGAPSEAPSTPGAAASHEPEPKPKPYRTTVRGRRDPQAAADRRHPGFVTAIDVAAASHRPADDLPQLLQEGAATTVRSIGGLGQFSAVSIRGSTAQQVAFYIDGVPLGASLSGLVSPSDLPLDGLDQVEVYRGYTPLAFGAAIGGAIHLRTDHRCQGPALRASAGVGSFSAYDARSAATLRLRRFCVDLRVGASGAAGSFPFLDTRGTPQNPADDRMILRRNNHYDRLLGQVGFAGRRGRWRIQGRELVLWKRQGIAGPGHAQARFTELDTLRGHSQLHVHRPAFAADAGSLAWVASAAIERRAFADPLGEVGLGNNDQRLVAGDLYLSPRATVPVGAAGSVELLGEARGELLGVADHLAEDPCGTSYPRLAVATGAQWEEHLGDRLLLAPTLRADGITSRGAGCGAPGVGDAEAGLSPRVAARLRLIGGLDLRASAGRAFRAPTLLELFGDRGYIIGNPALRAERSNYAEGGILLTWPRASGAERAEAAARHRVRLHAAGFWSRSEGLIQWLQTGPVIQPMNLQAASLRGLETSLHASIWDEVAIVDANYTLLASTHHSPERHIDGRRLPGRPLHQIFARVSLGGRARPGGVALAPRVFYTVESLSGTFLDAAERVAIPPRTLHGCGFTVDLAERLRFGLELRNLLDQRTTTWEPPIRGIPALTVPISDFIGYPLPGRSLWASLRIDLDPPRRRRPTPA